MDLTTIALEKQYTDSQRLGHIDQATLTFDGTVDESKVDAWLGLVFGGDDNGIFVKVSDAPLPIEYVKTVTIGFYKEVPPDLTLDASKFLVELVDKEAFPGFWMLLDTSHTRAYVFVVETAIVIEEEGTIPITLNPGTYYFVHRGGYYTKTVECETVHQIDAKFIPALDSLTMNGADGKQYKLAVDENGALVHTAIE